MLVEESPRSIQYKDAGVDVEAGERFVDRIRSAVQSTKTPGVLGEIGGFGGLFAPDLSGMAEPVLVSSADGVGTKLKLAFATGEHARVGGDLVRHCANDIAVLGARPLFFLDYLATGRLSDDVMAALVEGMAGACREEGIALLGGETAEMPGFYADGEYDAAAFIVGIADRARLLDGSGILPGDRLVGFPSSGLHTNGYSLARKIVEDTASLSLEATPACLGGETVADALLAPHLSYTKEMRALMADDSARVKGFAHITGGGIPGNLRRILPAGVDAVLNPGSWEEPAIFDLLREAGGVPEDDMRRAFNLGLGLVAVAGGETGAGLPVGSIVAGGGEVRFGPSRPAPESR
ncbi:MAG: phosphoribosylformylglycinamidine cyclo-ligase [Gemmatimonadota bacterium]|nr:phosphoribosylformylglycinamidine cyclo-ligase [Gemmatimonadota bacterium]MDP6528165.1 phosphoribosylformylglycinamidine cyclo-ligase [Gemmatimonadota bacterium]MDP6801775.1 phosphoribosylformylglycinamidine cyclo-ligase [Gemmatimonadota bacterium]MDP7031149.1 phosphoribosylformylglycinamidine cyclo-ligase [Gemmatimonadota bacterium]